MKAYILALIGALLLAGCAAEAPTATQIGPEEYDTLAAQEETVVIDVHVPEQEHLPGTDHVISYLEHEALQEAIPSKDTPVVVYCRSGSMSAHVAEDLLAAGYTQVHDLTGGANAYNAQ